MKRVRVLNLNNQVVPPSPVDLATQELAEAWVAEVKPTGAFGVVAHTEVVPNTGHPAYYDQQGNLLAEAVEPDTVEVPDAFTVEITDVTAEYAEKAAVALAKARRQAGEGVMDKVFAINMSKNLSPQQFQALLQNPTLGAVERLLKNGSLATAKALIESMAETYYTGPEKASIISDIDLALGG